MIDVNGKNNKVEQKNKKKIKTMGDVTLKGYDMYVTTHASTQTNVCDYTRLHSDFINSFSRS